MRVKEVLGGIDGFIAQEVNKLAGLEDDPGAQGNSDLHVSLENIERIIQSPQVVYSRR